MLMHALRVILLIVLACMHNCLYSTCVLDCKQNNTVIGVSYLNICNFLSNFTVYQSFSFSLQKIEVMLIEVVTIRSLAQSNYFD